MKFGTLAVHAGHEPDASTGAISPPIYATSTYAQVGVGKTKGYDYSRTINPTRVRLENSLAALEKAEYGLAFSSGMAAISAITTLLKKDENILVCNDLYGGTYRLFTKVLSNYGISHTQADATLPESLEDKISDQTRMIWLETPTNPLMTVLDIKRIAVVAKRHNQLLVVDNTFASPYVQNPISMGASVVVHSTTKYISGHGDVIGGGLATSDNEIYKRLKFIQNAVGSVPSPFDCFLTLRGIQTLHLRMKTHADNARAIAEFLENHKKVKSVFYPTLSSFPYSEIARRQMRSGGGMLSFRIKGGFRSAEKFVKSLRFFSLAESLGGVESLVEVPARMTHTSIPEDERRRLGIHDDLVRLSVGIEDKSDLLEDIRNALARV
jgi:cystathionine beta-lyase/cystathionine gamma-synthase